jgi:hypothetical protein
MRKKIILKERELVNLIKKILIEEKIPTSDEINPSNLRKNMGTKYDKNAQLNKPKVIKLQRRILSYPNCSEVMGIVDGQFGKNTQTALDQILKFGKCGSTDKTNTDPVDKKGSEEIAKDCIVVDYNTCQKRVSGKSQTTIGGSGTLLQCAKYTRISLQKYEPEFHTGNAWHALANTQGGGASLLYNMFGGGFNMDGLQKWIKESKYNDVICKKFIDLPADTHDVDKEVDRGKLAEQIFNSFPGGSGVSAGDLKLGDIVGMFWGPSSNKGKAFCESAKLDKDGNIINKKATINTHMGFVGAIKDGTPIIFHNVHGKFLSTPITQLINKSLQGGMVVWVTRNSDIAHAIGVEKGTEEKYFVEKAKDYFKSNRFSFKTDPGKI